MGDGAPTTLAVMVDNGGAKPVSIGDAVARIEIEDHDRLIDEVRVILDDAFDLAGANLANGHTITVSLGWGKELVTMFTGPLVRIGGRVGAGEGTGATTLVAHDPSVAMHQAHHSVIAQPDEKLSHLVARVVEPYSAQFTRGEIECKPDPTFERAALPNQLGLSDFEFLQSLATIWGARCFVEVNEDKPTFYFKSIQSLWAAEPLGRLELCRGAGSIISFRYERIAARATRQLTAAAVDPVSGETVRSVSDPAAPAAPAAGRMSRTVRVNEPGLTRANEKLAGGTAPAAPPAPGTIRGQASDPARARSYVVVDPTQALGYRAEVRAVGHVGLRAKGRVELTGMAPWAEGHWWIKRVTHIYTPARPAAAERRPTATYECALELTR